MPNQNKEDKISCTHVHIEIKNGQSAFDTLVFPVEMLPTLGQLGSLISIERQIKVGLKKILLTYFLCEINPGIGSRYLVGRVIQWLARRTAIPEVRDSNPVNLQIDGHRVDSALNEQTGFFNSVEGEAARERTGHPSQ